MGRKWGEFLYFSKSDRRALLLLAGMLLGVVLMSLIFFCLERGEETAERMSESLDGDTFPALVRRDSVPVVPASGYYRQKEAFVPETFFFDPNTADSTELLRLGLRPWQVRNIYKYRAKGGRYHRPDDFFRLYGLTQGDYERLRPYVRIADEYKLLSDVRPQAMQAKGEERDYPRQEKLEEGVRVDLNTADTALLKKVPGIGSYYARKITAYRERLGGFVSLAQLGEVEGLPEGLEQWFDLSPEVYRPLCINRLTVDKMRRHPYLNFYQSRVIAEHRRKYGAIKKLQALSLYEEFTPADLERLQPYVCFDE